MTNITPPLKWHGGKHYLAPKIVALMPPHVHYVEPFAGGLAVLLAKDPEGVSEVVNDLNMDLSNFWGVLQNRPLFDVFHRVMQVTPFSEPEFDAAADVLAGAPPDISYQLATGLKDPRAATSVARAVAFFVRCRQSLAGRMKSFATLSRTRTRRGMNEQVSAWLNAIEGLPAVHERMRRVVVLGPRPAVEVIHQQDGPNTLFYLDPPYHHPTRAGTDDYEHEMTERAHRRLLTTITHSNRRGLFMLSGYPSGLYQEFLSGWRYYDFDLPNNAAGGKSKRRMTERLWVNF